MYPSFLHIVKKRYVAVRERRKVTLRDCKKTYMSCVKKGEDAGEKRGGGRNGSSDGNCPAPKVAYEEWKSGIRNVSDRGDWR